MVRIVVALLAAATCSALRAGNRTEPAKAMTDHINHTANVAHIAAPMPPTQEEVQALRGSLEKIADGLEHMLQGNSASGTKIGPELKLFLGELRKVLTETAAMKDTASALERLTAAKQGIAQLTTDLAHRQEGIMKEEETQKDSLLLGVLMTRQKEPMADQLAILSSDDFKDLPVSAFLLAKHNATQPLFAQAANYLDTHVAKGIKIRVPSAEDHAERIKRTAANLQSFVDSMQKTLDVRSKAHEKRMQTLSAAVKAAKSQKDQRTMKAIQKREERRFKKWAAVQKHDIDAMKSSVAAVQKGDMGALEKAMAALKQSMAQRQNKNSDFLVLLDMGHKLMQKDCPYCVAQCVDKCHQEGQPYTTCLTTCATAGEF